MEIITLDKENIGHEHICCAISSSSTHLGVEAKKEWLRYRMDEGLRFKKLDARGKVFIEYIPVEYAWLPIDAKGYVVINCFWVSGSFAGHGYGKQLLEACEEDAKSQGYRGIVAIAGNKKKPYLTDKNFLLHHGYEVCDSCPPFFELVMKRFDKNTGLPKFKPSVRQGMGQGVKGIDIYYTTQCPFCIPYIEKLKPIISASSYPVQVHQIKDREFAQNFFAPVTTYCVFIDGQFYSNEILTPAKLEKLIFDAAK